MNKEDKFMKLKKIIISLITAVLMMTGAALPAYAGGGLSVRHRNWSDYLSADGDFPTLKERAFAFEIVKQTDNPKGLKDPAEAEKSVVFMAQVKSDENGKFVIEDIELRESGKYIARAMPYLYAGDVFEAVFEIDSRADALVYWDILNGGDEAAVAENFSAIVSALKMDIKAADMFADNSLFYKRLSEHEGFGELSAENAEAAQSFINDNIVYCGMAGTKSFSEFDGGLRFFEKYISENAPQEYAVYEKIRKSGRRQEAFINILSLLKPEISDREDVLKYFSEAAKRERAANVLYDIAEIVNYSQLSEYVNDGFYAEQLGITAYVERYNALKNKSSVDRAVGGILFKTAEDFKNAFEAALKAAEKRESGSTAGGGKSTGSGGGGGGTGGGGINLGGAPKGGVTAHESYKFLDMDSVPWAKEAVSFLYEKGIISGRSDTEFDPGADISREEFVKLTVCAFSLSGEGKAFDDVGADAWYAPFISAASANSVINGISESVFGIGLPVTRQDMAVIIYNALKDKPVCDDEAKAFVDYDEIEAYAIKAVSALKSVSVVSGTDEGRFNPRSHATRAEAARIIYNAMNRK